MQRMVRLTYNKGPYLYDVCLTTDNMRQTYVPKFRAEKFPESCREENHAAFSFMMMACSASCKVREVREEVQGCTKRDLHRLCEYGVRKLRYPVCRK